MLLHLALVPSRQSFPSFLGIACCCAAYVLLYDTRGSAVMLAPLHRFPLVHGFDVVGSRQMAISRLASSFAQHQLCLHAEQTV